MSMWWVVALGLLWTSVAHAAPGSTESRPVTFSNLVIRLEQDSIGLARGEFRVLILEELRAQGFKAVGAENVVFNIDKSHAADFALGGTVRILECRFNRQVRACRLGIDWEVLELRRQAVVYRARTAFAVRGIPKTETGELTGKRLVRGALERLMHRPRFKDVLTSPPVIEVDKVKDAAHYRACARAPEPLPGGAEAALNASVIVAFGQTHGSGFFINEDGLVLTAAHVVDGDQLIVKMRDGRELPATVVRRSKRRDAALLRVTRPETDQQPLPCLSLSDARPGVGEEIYAIGAPASEELGFTMTRGISSGMRDFEGQEYLQTDAPVSPGNSGGPLVGSDGRVRALVSWKVSADRVEGLAFGVPIASALSVLALSAGDATAPSLMTGAATVASAPAPVAVDDARDELPSLDPSGDKVRAEAAALSAATPAYVHVLKWGGLGVAGVGASLVVLTYAGYDTQKEEKELTREEYDRLMLFNDIGWVMTGVGLASFVTALLLKPSVEEATEKPAAKVEAQAGPGWVGVRGQF